MRLFDRKYINLIREFSIAWFKLKDQRSTFGFLWSFANPLIMTGVLFLLFRSRMAVGSETNYFLYILIGTVTWNFFVMTTSAGLGSLSGKASIVRNVAFPKEILVISSIGVFIIQHFFELLVVFLFIAAFGVGFSMHVILLPVIIGIELLLIVGISLFLSCACIFAFDLRHIWRYILRVVFFAVPAFYSVSEISPQFRWIVTINPISQIMTFSRDVLLYHRTPPLLNLAIVFIFSLFLIMAGYKFFKHYEFRVAEKV